MATTIDYAQLCTLLECFLAPDNTVRQQAEEAFNSYKQTHPDALLLGLVRVLREHPENHVRQQAAVAVRTVLRNIILNHADASWSRLNVETRHVLQNELLRCLETESDKAVRRSVCDTVADLGAKLSVSGEWPDLNAKLIAFIESSQPGCQAAGLKVLAELVPQISDVIRNNATGVQRMISNCAKSMDSEVRFECLCFVTALVLSEPRSVWKRVQNTLPDFIEGLHALVQTDQQDLAAEFLVKLVEIADNSSAFFKPHLLQFVQALFTIARSSDAEDEVRQMSVEVLLCIAEDKPQMCLKLPNFVSELVRTLLELMLTVEDDGDWIDQEEPADSAGDTTRNYDVGESGLDRLAAALGGENIMNIVFGYVSQYLRKDEWQYKLVGIMAISQTAEYLPEDGIDTHLDEIVNTLLAQLKDNHHRVRFAACQAIGQISLDHQPLFQKNYAGVILPALITAIDDPTPRVQSHAVSALINFAEEVEKADLMPFADTLMHKLFERISLDRPRMIREQCVTGIAVVAGVIEKSFLQYYPIVVPATKEIILKCTSKEERTMRGKAAECVSIIGLSVGSEVFEADAHEVMQVLLQIACEGMEADDPVREYIQETFCRICRTLKAGFLPYLQHLMPGVLKALNVTPEIVSEEESAEDMTLVSIANGKYSGLKTSVIEEMTQALDLLSTFVEILGAKFGDFLVPAAQSLLPLLDFCLSDDVKRSALSAMAQVLNAACELKAAGATALPVQAWVGEVLEKVFKSLSVEEDDIDIPDLDLMVAETGGLAKCLRNAGPNVLTSQQVAGVCSKVFQLMKESSQRRAELAARKQDPEFDEEDIGRLEDEETSEQTLRSTLLEIIGAIMTFHPELYLQNGAALCQKFIETYLHPNCTPDDRALALYVCDDVLEHLKDMGAPLWPTFAESLIASVRDTDPNVRQAAAFGVIQAAKCSQFPAELLQRAATSLVAVLTDSKSKEKSQLSATDNAIAALGVIVLHRGVQLQPSPEHYLNLWIDNLPLKVDDEEGRRVHGDLVDLLVKRNPEVLGANNSNLPKLAAICAAIYHTEFSTPQIDEGIRQFLQATGFDIIQTVGASFDKKLQKGLERIHRDVVAAQK